MTLEDEFNETVADEIGYADFDWDKLDADEVAAHDDAFEMEHDALDELERNATSDLVKWAIAQSWADWDNSARFQVIARQLIEGKRAHPALDYPEIGLELVDDLIFEGNPEAGRALLLDVEKLGAEPRLVHLTRASCDFAEGEDEAALQALQGLVDENEADGSFLLAVADTLLAFGFLEGAADVLNGAEQCASSDNDQVMLEIIAELRAAIEDEKG